MREKKIFYFSLLTSFLAHAFVLCCFVCANFFNKPGLLNQMEVVYYMEVKEIKEEPEKIRNIKSFKETKRNPLPKILSKRKSSATSPVMNTAEKQAVRIRMHKKQPSRIQAMEGKRQISVPVLKSEKISNPRYLRYHDRIRNKIKDRAYLYVDNPEFESGEVYLTFIISSDGILKQIRVIDEKTSANDFLRKVGLRSIRESSPYPKFPENLKYPELSFNVVISFKVGN